MGTDRNPSPVCTIYALAGDDAKIRYVGRTGKSLQERLQRHRWQANALSGSCQKPVSVWLRSQNHVTILPLEEVPRTIASSSEMEWVERLASQGVNLLNRMGNGWRPSPDHRQNISESNRRRFNDPAARARIGRISRERVFTEEQRAVLSERAKGRKHSPEARAKMSASRRGVPKSEETRARMKQAQQRRKESGGFGPISEETKKKISLSLRGRPKSEEWKQKMRDTNARKRAEKEVMGG